MSLRCGSSSSAGSAGDSETGSVLTCEETRVNTSCRYSEIVDSKSVGLIELKFENLLDMAWYLRADVLTMLNHSPWG